MNRALVTVIVPCFNQSQTVIETLSSVKSQSFGDWECIVVNDGSTDDSKKIIEDFVGDDQRFTLINTVNCGVSAARNTAALNAKGKYLLPLDSDNYILPECLEKCVACFEGNPRIRLVYTEARLFGEKNGLWNLPPFDYETMLRHNMVDNTALFLKSDFDRVGGYRTNMRKGLEDWDFFIALLHGCDNNQVVKISEPLFCYRVSSKGRRETVAASGQQEMLDLMVYNNFSIYQKFFPNIFSRILEYDYAKTMMNKFPVKVTINVLNAFSKTKKWLTRKI